MTLAVAAATNEPDGRFMVATADSRLTIGSIPLGQPGRFADNAQKAVVVGSSLVTMAGEWASVASATKVMEHIAQTRRGKPPSVLVDAADYYRWLRLSYLEYARHFLAQREMEDPNPRFETSDFARCEALVTGCTSDGVPTIICVTVQGMMRTASMQRAYPGQPAFGAIGDERSVPAAIDALRTTTVGPPSAMSGALSVIRAASRASLLRGKTIGGGIHVATWDGHASEWQWPYVRYNGKTFHRARARPAPPGTHVIDLEINEGPFHAAYPLGERRERAENLVHVNAGEHFCGGLRCHAHGNAYSVVDPDVHLLTKEEREALITLEMLLPATEEERKLARPWKFGQLQQSFSPAPGSTVFNAPDGQ